MNMKAKCVKVGCPAFGISKSVSWGQAIGFGAPNDRIVCNVCGELMQTTESINASAKGPSGKATPKSRGYKVPGRSSLSSAGPKLGSKKRTPKKFTTKVVTKRGPSKRG
jgi:hypothetical protein